MKFFSLKTGQSLDLLNSFYPDVAFGIFVSTVEITDSESAEEDPIRPYFSIALKRWQKRVILVIVGKRTFGVSWKIKE